MPDLSFYENHFRATSPDEAFGHFVAELRTYYDADYYVDWKKVFTNMERYRPELFLLSSLCSAPDKEQAARELLRKYPQVIPVLPVLIANAQRNSSRCIISLAEDLNQGLVNTYDFSASQAQLTDAQVETYVEFLLKSGILFLLEQIKSVFDYVAGVEVGLDSNARKNRSGKCAIEALRPTVEEVLRRLPQIDSKAEATYAFLAAQGCVLPSGITRKKWDWAFWTRKAPRRFVVLEVNHYGSTGSKPESIAAEYAARQQILNKEGIGFIWVTDGCGWLKMRSALREAFDRVDYLINIRLAKDGQLEWALRRLLLTGVKGRKELAA
jgi:type II restriction enzyme